VGRRVLTSSAIRRFESQAKKRETLINPHADEVKRMHKLGEAYRRVVSRLAEAKDTREMRSAAVEMKLLGEEINLLVKNLIESAKPK
jgi:hypothetical protein